MTTPRRRFSPSSPVWASLCRRASLRRTSSKCPLRPRSRCNMPTFRRFKLHFWGQRRGDERGATLVLTGLCMILLLWGGAMGVDIGFTVYGSRQAQAMADTAALDLARYINVADNQPNNTAAANYLNGKLANVATDNGSNAGLTMTLGLWKNGAFTAPKLGCTPTTPALTYSCNAVDVTANQSTPQIFF